MPDPYLRARAADVRDVGQQVARVLVGAPALHIEGDGILIADDLTPAQVADLDVTRVRGLVLASGSPTGHSAILARSRAIPAVVAAGPAVLAVPAGATIALDGTTGQVYVDPDADTLRGLRERDERGPGPAPRGHSRPRTHRPSRRTASRSRSAPTSAPSRTRTPRPVTAPTLAGLVRTEFLYLDRARRAHRRGAGRRSTESLAAALGGRPLTLRTLDIGGDKPLPYAPQPPEANPFLGVRGIRLALAERHLLHDQLRAVVEVAHETPVNLMFPMVSTVDELVEVAAPARRGGRRQRPRVGRTGSGSASWSRCRPTALKAAAFLDHVDFFSIGTNDLTQYALAAERGNAAVAELADPLDPGVLRLVDAVCRAADGQVPGRRLRRARRR